MKIIGLLGGMSWGSTASYYAMINQGVSNQLGGLHSAKLILNSVDFAEIEALQHQGRWGDTATMLTEAALAVEAAGADFLLICTNTMHKVAPALESVINIPLLHIADATADRLLGQNIECVGLLGTRFTMEQDFYISRLKAKGIDVLVPDDAERDRVHQVIYQELCLGQIKDDSRREYLAIMDKLVAQGAGGVILGCTEIGLLVRQSDTQIPLFDTAVIHAEAAVKLALG
ncbi:aspartate/glutamate racemase family protein [Shewanella sp. NIFS-20-20]|uniref:aspartate/glutamate racemase family protein n=1 Tax=Shewanella sp. NIFS-20-20 TaxID=2853806 RepID=UPI001C4501A0|nr:aspartate/glutamate racemase family protein [Shewanella sp. NIFS-20-20]MBV7317231.1 aspartate/glutamate racemase family protein [Shewanella sp. NIFS-20-20]